MKNITCTNCGKLGHDPKGCVDPKTSYGVINVDIDSSDELIDNSIIVDQFNISEPKKYMILSKKYPDVKCLIIVNNKSYEDNNETYFIDNECISYISEMDLFMFNYYKNKIKFMMVSRKYSVAFIEFIRGKYDVSDSKTIVELFEHMYQEEINMIKKKNFDDLLYYFLNRDGENKSELLNRVYEGYFSDEYCESKIKFNILVNPSNHADVPDGLSFYANKVKPKWSVPEWGFPKGRRDKITETDIECACREFEEETGLTKKDYVILKKIEPIIENLIGTNGVSYKHVYYLSINNRSTDKLFENYDSCEIGSVRWFTYEQAISLIRPYHTEKKKVLTQIFAFIMNCLIRENSNKHEY